MNEELEKLRSELEEIKQQNVDLSMRITELEDERDELSENLNRIKGSKLYKMSKPVRVIRSQVKRVTQYGSVSAVNNKIKSKKKLKKRYKDLGSLSFPDEERRIKEESKEYSTKVTFSILVPLYNTLG